MRFFSAVFRGKIRRMWPAGGFWQIRRHASGDKKKGCLRTGQTVRAAIARGDLVRKIRKIWSGSRRMATLGGCDRTRFPTHQRQVGIA
jgi:hypothetical protein